MADTLLDFTCPSGLANSLSELGDTQGGWVRPPAETGVGSDVSPFTSMQRSWSESAVYFMKLCTKFFGIKREYEDLLITPPVTVVFKLILNPSLSLPLMTLSLLWNWRNKTPHKLWPLILPVVLIRNLHYWCLSKNNTIPNATIRVKANNFSFKLSSEISRENQLISDFRFVYKLCQKK